MAGVPPANCGAVYPGMALDAAKPVAFPPAGGYKIPFSGFAQRKIASGRL
jgi:hypothetical protein